MENSRSSEVIRENLRLIRENIGEALGKYRNSGDKTEIMAVTKTVPAEIVNLVFDMGLNMIGENRVQEYQSKAELYDKRAEVHFIGHLQTNKVKYIIQPVSMVQSVDSFKLAMEISRLAAVNNKVMDILCEVNIGGEESKSGIAPGELAGLLEQISALDGLKIRGLMTIPPPADSDIYLGRMQELYLRFREDYAMDTLSMGMTHDYVQAVKYGSTLVRIGTGLFGARNYK